MSSLTSREDSLTSASSHPKPLEGISTVPDSKNNLSQEPSPPIQDSDFPISIEFNMLLLDTPPEIFQRIVAIYVHTAGIRQASKLRVVCSESH
jgi:hypothetical protein